MVYAELKDLAAGWREIDDDERAIAEEIILRASVFLDGIVSRYKIDVNDKAEQLKIVCCDLAQRRLEHANSTRIVSETMTAGVYSETTNYGSKGSYSWRLTDEDKELLGINKSGFACIPMW